MTAFLYCNPLLKHAHIHATIELDSASQPRVIHGVKTAVTYCCQRHGTTGPPLSLGDCQQPSLEASMSQGESSFFIRPIDLLLVPLPPRHGESPPASKTGTSAPFGLPETKQLINNALCALSMGRHMTRRRRGLRGMRKASAGKSLLLAADDVLH